MQAKDLTLEGATNSQIGFTQKARINAQRLCEKLKRLEDNKQEASKNQ